MNWLSQVLIVAVVFFFCYKMIEVFVHRKERINLVEKLGNENLAKNSNLELGKILANSDGGKYWPLRLGGLIIGLGLGLLIGYLIIYSMGFETVCGYRGDQVGTIYGASTLLFGGIGLVAAFIIERNMRKRESK